jgi:hypothetical protein
MKTHLDMNTKQIAVATFMRFRSHGHTFAEARMKTFKALENTLQMEWGTFKRRLDSWLAEP